MRKGFWLALAVLFGVLTTSFVWNFSWYQKIEPESETASPVNIFTPISEKSGGEYFYFSKTLAKKPKISATAYLAGDLDTGEVILAKNQGQRLPIASVSKLMTALVASDNAGSGEIAKVSKKAIATDGRNGNFKTGEQLKISDILYPLLLESSNDASEILAEHFNRENFIQKMNEKAASLSMLKTHYADPSGLSAKNQSTVSDLFKLGSFLKNEKPDLLKIASARSHSVKKHNWASNNQFLKKEGYLGGKSGYTDPAKQTVVSLFSLPLGESTYRNIGIAILGSRDRYRDVENILNYLKRNIYYGRESDANTAWVKQKEAGNIFEDIGEPDFVKMAFTGDIMMDRGVRNSVIKNFAGDYSALFEKLDVLKKSDIVFANLEGPAGDKGADLRNLYSFRMDPSIVPALKGAGFSVLSVANNHVGDWGLDAYTDTLARLKENEILYAGGGLTRVEAEKVTVIEKNGMKIGFLAFSDVGPDWMEVKADKPGLLIASDPRLPEIIQNATKAVDYLIVSFHFGDEYKPKHNARQERLAHQAVDNGAKIVIGQHPHVIEDTEVYKNSFIAYSLGNFIFDQSWSEPTMRGILLNIKLEKNGTMTVRKDTVKISKAFRPETITKGKEEKVKFQEVKNRVR